MLILNWTYIGNDFMSRHVVGERKYEAPDRERLIEKRKMTSEWANTAGK